MTRSPVAGAASSNGRSGCIKNAVMAPKYSGTASGLMNMGSAFAAIVSPLVAGYVIDLTGNWYLPFLMSMGLLALGAMTAFLMHPERPFEDAAPAIGDRVVLFPA